MSGGQWNYLWSQIYSMAEEIQDLINNDYIFNPDTPRECNLLENLTDEQRKKFRAIMVEHVKDLARVSAINKSLDYFIEDDNSIETTLREIEEINNKNKYIHHS